MNRLSQYFAERDAKRKPMMVKAMFNCGGMSMIGALDLGEALLIAQDEMTDGGTNVVEFWENDS